jgi:predicted metalloprotease
MVGGGLTVVVIAVVAMLLGVDPGAVLGPLGGGGGTGTQEPYQPTAEEQELFQFVKVVLANTEDVWNRLFQEAGRRYEEPRMVVFSGRVESACGLASAAVGPFYCPPDKSVYIDLAFFDQLSRRFGAPGDFAQAYVIAHEVGHHVQNLLGISERTHRMQQQSDKVTANQLSVRLELQADFFAGVWAHHADRWKGVLEEGDIEEALRAATAIGDDALQREAQGHVVPDSFTHGTSAQRMAWFRHGYRTGDMAQGDTFDDEHFARIR